MMWEPKELPEAKQYRYREGARNEWTTDEDVTAYQYVWWYGPVSADLLDDDEKPHASGHACFHDIAEFLGDDLLAHGAGTYRPQTYYIRGAHGLVYHAQPGDFIVRHASGLRVYPPRKFHDTFMEVES